MVEICIYYSVFFFFLVDLYYHGTYTTRIQDARHERRIIACSRGRNCYILRRQSQVQHFVVLQNHVVIVKIRIGRTVQLLQLLLLNALQNERRRRGFSFKHFNKYAFV